MFGIPLDGIEVYSKKETPNLQKGFHHVPICPQFFERFVGIVLGANVLLHQTRFFRTFTLQHLSQQFLNSLRDDTIVTNE